MTAACVEEFVRLADAARSQPERNDITDADLRDVLTAAVRLYAARAEAREEFPLPLTVEQVTATDVAVAVSEMIRAADLNMFDVSMWHSRQRQRGS